MIDNQALVWRRSSRCASGACVEVAIIAETIFVRDSKDGDGPILTFDHTTWSDFIAAIKAHELSL